MELDELYRKYSNSELELDDAAEQFKEMVIRLISSNGIPEKERSELTMHKSSLEEYIVNLRKFKNEAAIGIPKSDEKLEETNFKLRRIIESVTLEIKDCIEKPNDIKKPIDELNKSIFGGKIKEIQKENQFRDWIFALIGENEIIKLKEMLSYLSGTIDGEKKIVSGFSYWGIIPTHEWILACKDQFYIMRPSIEDFPNRWANIYNSIEEITYNYVSLGVGDGEKDVSILADLVIKNAKVKYFPVDMSPEMLYYGTKIAIDRVPNLKKTQILPLQVDFSHPKKLHEIRSMLDILTEGPTIFALLGNTLANFDSDQDLLRNLSNILNKGDSLLLEVARTKNINEDSKRIAKHEYSQNAFKKFALSSLVQSINIDLHDDWIEIEMNEEPITDKDSRKKALKISVWYKNKGQNADVRFLDMETISFPAGDKIRLYLSRKYTSDGLNYLLDYSNLEILTNDSEYKSSDGNLGNEVILLRKPLA